MQVPPAPVNSQFPQNVVPVVPAPPTGGTVLPSHPLLRHLKGEAKFFTYRLTPGTRRLEKIWDKKPNYVRLESGLKSALEAERELVLSGAAQSPAFAPGTGDYFYNLSRHKHPETGELTQIAAEAIAAYKARLTPGYALGYYFTAESQRFFYDLDGCRNPETEELTPIGAEAVNFFRSAGAYIAVSYSGTGLHVVGRYTGDRPAHETDNATHGLELYTGDRGMAIGTAVEGNPDADCTGLLTLWLIPEYFPKTSRAVERPQVDPSAMGDLGAADVEAGLDYLRSACREFESEEGLWNNGITSLFFVAGRIVARGVLSADEAWAKVCELPKIQTYLEEDEYKVTENWARAIRDSSSEPWIAPIDVAQIAFKVDVPLPAGASLVPVAPPARSYLPEGQIAEMAAIVAANPNKDEAIAYMMQLGTQESIAAAFATLYEGQLKFDHSRKRWHIWDGSRWREDDRNRVFNTAVKHCREKNTEGKASIGTASFARGVEDIASSSPSLSAVSSEWDRDNYLLNTPAGTVDLRTGLTREPSPDDMITKSTTASPSTVSEGLAFMKFLREITQDDRELIEFHQVSLGAILSGAVENHWLLFWTGTGRNGKNTLGELVQHVMGDYAKKIEASTLMSKKFKSHSEEIADLHGSRLAISSELNDGDHWDEARINELTGDATLSARYLYGNRFQFVRSHKHLVYANYKPQLRAVSDAIRSRLKIIPFKVSFKGREDADLPGRLRGEMGFVLQWLIDGHRKWLAAGKKLPNCAVVEAESAEYFEKQSTPQLWLKECCEIRHDLPTIQLSTIMELYRSYKDWKISRGEIPVTKGRWEEQALQGFQRGENRRGYCVLGLRLLLPFGDAPLPPGVIQ